MSKVASALLIVAAFIAGGLVGILAFIYATGGPATAEAATGSRPPPVGTPPPTDDGQILFAVTSEGSEARFFIDEVLRGRETTVVGTTTAVSGELTISFGDDFTVEFGKFRVNARSLATDEEMRDRMIRSRILQSARDEYAFIDFVPAEVRRLPNSAGVGDRVSFDLIGDLTVRGVTRSVTFATELELVSRNEIQGTGSTVIQYSDFDLTIPRVPLVASVSDVVRIEIEFSGRAGEKTAALESVPVAAAGRDQIGQRGPRDK